MRSFFVAHDLLEIVERRETKPADEATAKAWTKKDAKAMYVISSSMEYAQLNFLVTSSSASEMWKELLSIHEQKRASNKLALISKFDEHRWSMDIDQGVTDVMIIAKILSTLPSKFHAFVPAWDSVPDDKQTLAYLRKRFFREKARMSSTDNLNSALATMSVSNDRKKADHQQGSTPDQRNTNKTCRYCKKTGHIEKYCYSKKRDKRDTNKSSKNYKQDSPNESPRNMSAFVVSSPNSSRSLEWFHETDETNVWLLSGASRYISCKGDWFSELTPSKNEFVYLGDGTKLSVEGKGTILISRLINGEWHDGLINNVLYVPSLRKN